MNDVLVHFVNDGEDVSVKDFFEATWDFLTCDSNNETVDENGRSVYRVKTEDFSIYGELFVSSTYGVVRALKIREWKDDPVSLIDTRLVAKNVADNFDATDPVRRVVTGFQVGLANCNGKYHILFENKIGN